MAGVTSPSWRHFPLCCPSGGPHSWPLSVLTSVWKNGWTGRGVLESIRWSPGLVLLHHCYHGAVCSFNFFLQCISLS